MEQLLTEEEFQSRLASLKGRRFPLLSKGGLTLVDAMGSDRRIVEAARTTSDITGKGDADDRNLLRYLVRHRHTTPREFPVVCFLVEIPMDAWRQWIRHRTASVNEFSTRYSEVPDVNDTTDPVAWRLQATTNRQGSSGEFVTAFPEGYDVDTMGPEPTPVLVKSRRTAGEYLSSQEKQLHDLQRSVYEERIRFGVAKEQARKDLCLSTYTRAFWQNDLHNTLHFLGLRMDAHAQLEIRVYANQMSEILRQLYPVTWAAFEDYQLNASTLTALDKLVIKNLVEDAHGWAFDAHNTGREEKIFMPPYPIERFMECQHPDWKELQRCRERDECLQKLQNLGLVRAA